MTAAATVLAPAQEWRPSRTHGTSVATSLNGRQRQYCAFAGITHGQKTHNVIEKPLLHELAREIQPGALHRGRLYHVQAKRLYAAIGEADSRNRKPAPLGRFVERLTLLHAVLDDYLARRRAPVDVRAFILRHAVLLKMLHQWTIRVLVPKPFAKALPLDKRAAFEELARLNKV